ncbi:MAG TPA: DEAD/DEAH box helicase [Ilumatobacteraceae bacterium]|jgi:ATP-dependent RNA helicase DeaD|nr:DEAD/DEAH box helicase [Ilumatobacteraceae bacterium]
MTDHANGGHHEDSGSVEDGGFETLGLRPELLSTISDLGYEEPTPIQRETIPHLLAGRDLLGQAATGTGKTAAFALPALQMIDSAAKVSPFALILVPTRELAMQVSEAIFKYGRDLHVRVTPIYGGQPIYRQLQALDRGVHIVVATPGRALDHIGRGSLQLDSIKTVILDEADEMLDMGFADDIDSILQMTPEERQTVLFSATMPARINALARKYQRDPVRIQIHRGDSQPGTALVRQSAYMVQRSHKPAALGRILDIEAPKATLVFCRTRTEVDQLTEKMNGRGYRAEALHGGMDQPQRDRVMGRLRDGTAELLVATDVAARGLDVDTLTHVVNYDVPSAPESYVHRIGRVGRAGRQGVAITLAEPREQRLLFNIEKLTKQKIAIERVPTVADLRARQIEQTVNAVREALAADDLDDYNEVLNALSGDHNLRTIALAAVKLAHEASGATVDEAEIPDFSHKVERGPRGDRPAGDTRPGHRGQRGAPGPRGGGSPGTAFIYVALGRKVGIRAGDLVGLIANESNLSGREIGPIKLTEQYSIVGVPESRVDDVIQSLKGTLLKGKRPNARRYTE